MSGPVWKQLQKILTTYGRDLCDDPKRVRALLSDYCPGLKLEVNLLALAVEHRLAAELRDSSTHLPWAAVAGRLERRMMEELGVTADRARWTIETWALALGRQLPAAPKATPALPPAAPVATLVADEAVQLVEVNLVPTPVPLGKPVPRWTRPPQFSGKLLPGRSGTWWWLALLYITLLLLIALVPVLLGVLLGKPTAAELLGWLAWFATGPVLSALAASFRARRYVYFGKNYDLTAIPAWMLGFLWAACTAGLYVGYNVCLAIVWGIALVSFEQSEHGQFNPGLPLAGGAAALLTLFGLVEGAWAGKYQAAVLRLLEPVFRLRALLGILVLLGTVALTAVCLNLYVARSLASARWQELVFLVIGLLCLLGLLIPFILPSRGNRRKPWLLCVVLCAVQAVMLSNLPEGWWRHLPFQRSLRTYSGHTSSVVGLAVSPDGNTLVSVGDSDRSSEARTWHVLTGEEGSLPSPPEFKGGYSGMAYSRDGKWLAGMTERGTIYLWDAARNKYETKFEAPHSVATSALVFTPDGERILVSGGSYSPELTVFERATRERHGRSLQLPGGRSEACALSPDARYLACSTADGRVHLWELPQDKKEIRGGGDWAPSRSFRAHARGAVSLAFSPDGSRLATAANPADQRAGLREIRIWDPNTGQELGTVIGPSLEVRHLAFSPDGKWLTAATAEGTVTVYEAVTGREVRTLFASPYEIRAVVFSPDGSRLFTGGNDQKVRAWSLRGLR